MKTRSLTFGDAVAIHQLTRRWETFWGAPMVTPLEEVEDDLRHPHLDLSEDTRGYWLDDRLVAMGRIWHRPSGVGQERAYAFGFVDPVHRGKGIGRDLMSWQVDRGAALLENIDNDLPKYLRADEWDWIEESHRMYRRFDFRPVRYFTEMIKELAGKEEAAPIAGVEIIPYDRSFDDEALDAMNRSFADHWGSTPTDFDSFQHRLVGHGTRLDQSFLAVAGDEVVGLALNAHFPEDEQTLHRKDGWVETLGVVREHRRKGVATALLKASFNVFVGAGFTHSALGVDTESPTDAFTLYTGLGYKPTHRSLTSQLQIG